MPLVIDVFLQKDFSRGVFGDVGGKGERGREIWELEDWLGGECCFQHCKGDIDRSLRILGKIVHP